MKRRILASSTFAKSFRDLPKPAQTRIRAGLAKLADDPLTPRSGADIKLLAATDPPKHRLRVGDYRIVYIVDRSTVKLLDLFSRARGYRE